jgi:hypothetical protein
VRLLRCLGTLVGAVALGQAGPAWSLPAFARETGVPCAVCHTQAFGPALTAYGRNFKLHAYALGTQKTIPLSADLIASFTHTAESQPPAPHFSGNDNFALDDVNGYFAGRIADHVGAFAQVTYDGIARHTSWGVLDARWARDFTLGSTNTLFGVTLNNFPTVQDVWNSTYAWQYPVPGARLANGPNAAPQIFGFFALQTLGVTGYALIDNTFYLEAGGYRKLSEKLQSDLGNSDPAAERGIDGTAPYWRAAVQKSTGPHYVSMGVLGFTPNVQLPGQPGAGTDNYSDYGFDATYQFANGGLHTFNAYLSYIHEHQRLFGSTAVGASSSIDNDLHTLNISAQYGYRQTYSVTLAYFNVSGSSNRALYAPGEWFGSANGSPDSRGYNIQLECVPFGKADSYAKPLLNLRVGVQFTGYLHFNGGNANYDGFGHSASDNNTLFLYVWTAI